jgi:hypothetical protein
MTASKPRLAFFERYLSLWVGLCMVGGMMLGTLMPSAVQALRGMEFALADQCPDCDPDLADDHAHDDEGGFHVHPQRGA